jgi:hypothetical protein
MMLASHQNASRGSANRRASIELGKSYSFASHAIEMWGFDHFLSVAPQVPIPEIVGHDPNDVRAIVGKCISDAGNHETHDETA